jgi:hypothetical protein
MLFTIENSEDETQKCIFDKQLIFKRKKYHYFEGIKEFYNNMSIISKLYKQSSVINN